MFRKKRDLSFRMVAYVLLLWVLTLPALPIFATADSDLSAGIFDDADDDTDDDSIIGALSTLDLNLVAPIPPPLPANPPQLVEGPALVQAEHPVPSVAILSRASRSPPLS